MAGHFIPPRQGKLVVGLTRIPVLEFLARFTELLLSLLLVGDPQHHLQSLQTMANFVTEAKHHVGVDHLERSEHSPDTGNKYDVEFDFTPEEQRKIIHRIDRRLIITVGVMYCVSLMDRTNLSAAAIAGMTRELVLVGFRYVSRAGNARRAEDHELTLYEIVNHHSCLLYHVCGVSTSSDGTLQEDRSKVVSECYHIFVGM